MYTDLEILFELEDHELSEIGMPLGAVKKMRKAIQKELDREKVPARRAPQHAHGPITWHMPRRTRRQPR